MASEQVESLFGDLRSAVANHHVLAAHEIAKSIYSLDRDFHAEAMIPYLQSHPVGDGAMTRDTLVRLEQFKQWVRKTLDLLHENVHERRWVIGVLSRLIDAISISDPCVGTTYYDELNNCLYFRLDFPPSAGFKIVRGQYVLRAEWRDALWAVLDERGLL